MIGLMIIFIISIILIGIMYISKNFISDYVVAIPYILVKLTKGENDGLVSINSAKRDEFKGMLGNHYNIL